MSSLSTTVRSEIMETKESNPVLAYGEPPWLFRGRALYQVHLVKAETARAFIPKEFKLVEAFGYTLGGFFLANYEDSPAGIFDELVVIAGTVWNPPTSCAWAARVLVSSDKACDHGRKDVGLPSQVAKFTKRVAALPLTKKSRFHDFLQNIGMTGSSDKQKNETSIQVKEKNDHIPIDFCSINLPIDNLKKWMGPPVKMSLPSFSGLTEHNPHLLKYSCQIECRLRVVGAVKLSGPTPVDTHSETCSELGGSESELTNGDDSIDYKRNLSISLMLSKPILALEFNCLTMKVEAPTVVPQR